MNVAPYIVAGLNPEIHLLVKSNTSPIDFRYNNLDGNSPFDMEDDTKVKHANSLLPFTIKIDGIEHAFSFNNVFTSYTEGGTPILIAVDICLDHGFGTAKKNLIKLFDADTFNIPLFISHIIISNTIHLNPAQICEKNVMHVDSYYSLIKCKKEREQHILEDMYPSFFGNGYKMICVDPCPCGSLLDFCSLAAESQAGHINIVNALLKAGAYVDILDINGLTPLYMAFFYGHNIIARSLINAGANLNLSLFIASWKGAIHVVRHLIELGANVSAVDFYGYTPLYIALFYGHKPIAQILIEEGADIDQSLLVASRMGAIQVVNNLIDLKVSQNQLNVRILHEKLYLEMQFHFRSFMNYLYVKSPYLLAFCLKFSRECYNSFMHIFFYTTLSKHKDMVPILLNLKNAVEPITSGYWTDFSRDCDDFLLKTYHSYDEVKNHHNLSKNQNTNHPRYDSTTFFRFKAATHSDSVFLDKFMGGIKRNAQKERFIPYNPTFLASKKPVLSKKDAICHTEKEEIKQHRTMENTI